MVREISIEDIKETGFTSWGEFLMSIDQYSSDNMGVNYGYRNLQKEPKNINLVIGHSMLENLALEECRVLLPMIKINSFTEFMEKIEKANKHHDNSYPIDIIVRNMNDQIIIRKIIFDIRLIRRLAAIEKSVSDYLFYNEEKKCK